MATLGVPLQSVRPASLRDLWLKLSPPCANLECGHTRNPWKRLRRKSPGVHLNGLRYCLEGCVEAPLHETLQRAQRNSKPPAFHHRIPLGLLLLSRQQLTVEQLRSGIEAQYRAGRGRLGEWLQTLGYVTEQQVMAAVARQWSCPVLRMDADTPKMLSKPQIPIALLKAFQMFPVEFVSARSTLHVAFADSLDYAALYALEQMLECRTEACITLPTHLQRWIRTLAEDRREREMVFDRLPLSEFNRIIRSYCARISASEIKVVSCGTHVWVRLVGRQNRPLDLLLSL